MEVLEKLLNIWRKHSLLFNCNIDHTMETIRTFGGLLR